MTKKQQNRLFKRLKSDTYLRFIPNESIRIETRLELLQLVTKRIESQTTQKEVAKMLSVSINTIKRFESGKCNNLALFVSYKSLFGDLFTRNHHNKKYKFI